MLRKFRQRSSNEVNRSYQQSTATDLAESSDSSTDQIVESLLALNEKKEASTLQSIMPSRDIPDLPKSLLDHEDTIAAPPPTSDDDDLLLLSKYDVPETSPVQTPEEQPAISRDISPYSPSPLIGYDGKSSRATFGASQATYDVEVDTSPVYPSAPQEWTTAPENVVETEPVIANTVSQDTLETAPSSSSIMPEEIEDLVYAPEDEAQPIYPSRNENRLTVWVQRLILLALTVTTISIFVAYWLISTGQIIP